MTKKIAVDITDRWTALPANYEIKGVAKNFIENKSSADYISPETADISTLSGNGIFKDDESVIKIDSGETINDLIECLKEMIFDETATYYVLYKGNL